MHGVQHSANERQKNVVYIFESVYCWLPFGVWSARHLYASFCTEIQEQFGSIFRPRWSRRLLAWYHCEDSTHANEVFKTFNV
jgi:hypothetical protein